MAEYILIITIYNFEIFFFRRLCQLSRHMIKILFRNGLRSLVKQMPYSFVNILDRTIVGYPLLYTHIWSLEPVLIIMVHSRKNIPSSNDIKTKPRY